VRFVGHTAQTGELLDAADLFVSPVRYEAYGLAAHEALCRAVPVIISATAGIVERIPPDLRDLIIPDAEDVRALETRIRLWADDPGRWRERARRASADLRGYTDEDMAARIASLVENVA
jgi:glycosyltransferase involved in cell wall biosynthesis